SVTMTFARSATSSKDPEANGSEDVMRETCSTMPGSLGSPTNVASHPDVSTATPTPALPIDPPSAQSARPAAVSAEATVGGLQRSFPVLSAVIVGVLVVAFIGEYVLSRSDEPEPAALLAFGGMSANAVSRGEWFRLLSASLLHGG